jgi:hypothetical protein
VREEVLRGEVSGAPVVDANEVVAAALRERKDTTVEEDDRNLRLVERFDDLLIGVVIFRARLKRFGFAEVSIRFGEQRICFRGDSGGSE